MSTQKTTIALAALKQTALFRLLASDITSSLQSTATSIFPQDILNAQIQERKLVGPIPVQVLDVEDIGHSRWSQIEAIEAAERGETTKGREIIRVVPTEEGTSDPEAVSANGPHKLLVQDAKGVRMYGFELSKVDGISLSMDIGSKLLLKNVLVTRGVLLLEPGNVTLVGGKIENFHKAWKEGRKAQLKETIGPPSET